MRKYVREGSRLLPGCSTIHFDEITKKKIFASIDRMTTTKKMLTEKYMQVKFKIGRIPTNLAKLILCYLLTMQKRMIISSGL